MSVQTSPSSERPLHDFELYLHNVLDQLDPLSRVVAPAICMQSKEGANLPRQARDRSYRSVDGVHGPASAQWRPRSAPTAR